MHEKNWRPPTGGEEVVRQMEKRLKRTERRPNPTKAADFLGPALGPYAVEVDDLNSEVATFNGIISVPVDAVNGPLPSVPLVGEVLGIYGVGGRQVLSTYRAIDVPHRSFVRTYNYIAGTSNIIWGDWVEAGSGADTGRGSTAQRDVFFGSLATNAERAALANRQVKWYNTTTRRWESYYAASTIAGLTVPALIAGHASGWYPEPGTLMQAHRGKTDGFQALAAGDVTQVQLGAMQQNVGGFASSGISGFTVPVGGYYDMQARAYFAGPAATYSIAILFVGGAQLITNNDAKPSGEDQTVVADTSAPVVAGAALSLRALAPVATSVWGELDGAGYNGCSLSAKYVGPPVMS